MSNKIPIKKPIPVVKTNKAAKPLITNKPDSIQKPAIKSKNKTETQLHGLIVKKDWKHFQIIIIIIKKKNKKRIKMIMLHNVYLFSLIKH